MPSLFSILHILHQISLYLFPDILPAFYFQYIVDSSERFEVQILPPWLERSSSNSHEPRHKYRREVYMLMLSSKFLVLDQCPIEKKSSFLGRSLSLVLVGCICSFSQSVLSLLHGLSNRLETHTALKLLHWSHL